MIKYISIVLLFVVVVSCKKDEDTEKQPVCIDYELVEETVEDIRDYEVYHTILDSLFEESIYVYQKISETKGDSEELMQYLNTSSVVVDSVTVKDYIDNENGNHFLSDKLFDYYLTTPEEMNCLRNNGFKKGVISFKQPGYSEDGTTALVEYGYTCGGLCGYGNYVILSKEGDNWKIITIIHSWIA